MHEAIADNIAYKARSAGTLLLIWLSVSLVWPVVRLPFHPGAIAITAVAVVLAAVLRFLISFTTGLLAFWTTRATSIMELHAGISLFLAGRIAPLSLLPPVVAGVASWLWFPYMLSFPVSLLTGAAHGHDLWVGFRGQLIWIAIWLVACRAAWRAGIKRYGAAGG